MAHAGDPATHPLLSREFERITDEYTQTGVRQQTTSFHNTDGVRGVSPGFIGIQAYASNTVAWRHIRVKP